ncbi:carboxymethylenebutenolidase isoform X2 [Turdus rufiventris]|nr:carboxymethylenebutenolidase isoform X2 [Turdus rufiventris]
MSAQFLYIYTTISQGYGCNQVYLLKLSVDPARSGFQMADPFLYDTGERSHYGCLGHEVQIEYLKAYVCRPSFSTDKAVIVVHDVFGWRFPDIRYIVDLIAGIVRDSEERYSLLNPTFFIFGEKDHTISLDQIFLLEDKLKQYCKVPYKIKVYPGQVHGFAQLKPEDMKPDDKPYIEEARRDMIDWIKMFV